MRDAGSADFRLLWPVPDLATISALAAGGSVVQGGRRHERDALPWVELELVFGLAAPAAHCGLRRRSRGRRAIALRHGRSHGVAHQPNRYAGPARRPDYPGLRQRHQGICSRGNDANPNDPAIPATMYGPELFTVSKNLGTGATQHIIGRGDIQVRDPHVVAIDGITATLQDCRSDKTTFISLLRYRFACRGLRQWRRS